MRTTTTMLAVGATALATTRHAQHQQSAVQAPLAGHLTVASQMREHHTELAQQRLTRKAWRLADKVAHCAAAASLPGPIAAQIRDEPPARLARRVRTCAASSRTRARDRARRARVARASAASPTLRGDRRVRVRRQPGHEHRQRVLRQVPVHALHLAERRRQPATPPPPARPSRTSAPRLLYAREGASPWPVCGR